MAILRQWKYALQEDGKFVPANGWVLDSCSLSRLPNQVCPDHYLQVSFSKRIILGMSRHCPMNSCGFLHECGKIKGYLIFGFSKRKVPTVVSKFCLFVKGIGNGKIIIMQHARVRSASSIMEGSHEQNVSQVI